MPRGRAKPEPKKRQATQGAATEAAPETSRSRKASPAEGTFVEIIPRKTAPQVAIFGAGIAGLTAAHELIERGFLVEVYEAQAPSVVEQLAGAACGLGGMARTQWARVQDEQSGRVPEFVAAEPLRVSVSHLEIPFAAGSAALTTRARQMLDTQIIPALERAEVERLEIQGFSEERDDPQGVEERCVCVSKADARSNQAVKLAGITASTTTKRIDYRRARAVAEYVCAALQGKRDCRISALGGGLGHADDWTRRDDERNHVICQIAETWLPGEHGFRFFPSFYRHLFDTMSRTPIPSEDPSAFVETARTVLDNVSPTTFFGLSTERNDRLTEFRRQPSRSVQELFDQLTDTLKALGHTLSDINHLNAKLFRYLTSCSRRREREYEHITWAEFLESERFTPVFRKYLESTAETLVAMQAGRSDARTYGNISVQMIRDQVVGTPRTDGTLNGPTSLAWFEHWRRYLESQGVRFVHARLDDFHLLDHGDGTHSTWAEVQLDPDTQHASVRRLMRDYYVLALPPHELQRLARQNAELDGSDFDAVRDFNLGDPSAKETGGALEHMIGVQYFLDSDFPFLRGHIILPDSAWRLSAVSQPQFWFQHRGWWSGYRGIVSVDVSNLHSADPAWEHTRDEIARGVWTQLVSSIEKKVHHRRRGAEPTVGADGKELQGKEHIPRPRFFTVDEALEFGDHGGVRRNRTPYLLNLRGDYRKRPGRPNHYTVHKQIVLAGVLMQTFTRLTTMEAANESGRHAVNAILNQAGFRGERCDIWDPEKNEFSDLKLLVDLDAQLVEMGLPHFLDILDLREVPRDLLRPNPDLRALGLLIPA